MSQWFHSITFEDSWETLDGDETLADALQKASVTRRAIYRSIIRKEGKEAVPSPQYIFDNIFRMCVLFSFFSVPPHVKRTIPSGYI